MSASEEQGSKDQDQDQHQLPWFGSNDEGDIDLFSSVGYGGFPKAIEEENSDRRQSTVWGATKQEKDETTSLSSKVRESLSSLRNSLKSPRRSATPNRAVVEDFGRQVSSASAGVADESVPYGKEIKDEEKSVHSSSSSTANSRRDLIQSNMGREPIDPYGGGAPVCVIYFIFWLFVVMLAFDDTK